MMTQYCGNFQQLLSLQRNSMEIRSLNYSVVSIKQGAGNKRKEWAEFLIHYMKNHEQVFFSKNTK